jgi:hypothetical protein
MESKEEMEKRGLDSPDDGDALALTFAQRVLPLEERPRRGRIRTDPYVQPEELDEVVEPNGLESKLETIQWSAPIGPSK